MSTLWQHLPQEPPLARFISETKTNNAALCCKMRICSAMSGHGLRPVITSGVTNRTVGKVPSHACETLTFEALQNSKRGICHLAPTKHLFPIMLEVWFAKFRGISTFQISIENVTNLVSQLPCSSHLGNLGFSWLGLAWLSWLGSAWPGRFRFQTGSPKDAKPILAPSVMNDCTDLWLGRVNRTQP